MIVVVAIACVLVVVASLAALAFVAHKQAGLIDRTLKSLESHQRHAHAFQHRLLSAALSSRAQEFVAIERVSPAPSPVDEPETEEERRAYRASILRELREMTGVAPSDLPDYPEGM